MELNFQYQQWIRKVQSTGRVELPKGYYEIFNILPGDKVFIVLRDDKTH